MTNDEDAFLETRGLKLEATEVELNLRKGDRKEEKDEELCGEARVRDNVGFADCREAAIVCFSLLWSKIETSIQKCDYKWDSVLIYQNATLLNEISFKICVTVLRSLSYL